MSKHTPGPWTYLRNPEGTRWIIDAGAFHAIAATAGYEPDNEANARLIAAAPEMLDALEAVWKYSLVIESSVRRGDGPEQYAGVLEALRLVKEVRAAIAKAEGGAA